MAQGEGVSRGCSQVAPTRTRTRTLSCALYETRFLLTIATYHHITTTGNGGSGGPRDSDIHDTHITGSRGTRGGGLILIRTL